MSEPLTPTELAEALVVHRREGTYAAAARAIGRDESTVRKALRRHHAPERAELFANELADAHVNALRATRHARRRALSALQTATDPRDVALLAHVLHENLRAVSQARTAHARLVAVAEQCSPSARIVEYDDTPITELSDTELHARIARLAAAVHDESVKAVSGLDAATLTERASQGLARLVVAAKAGDTDAAITLAPLLEAPAPAPGTIYLPRLRDT